MSFWKYYIGINLLLFLITIVTISMSSKIDSFNSYEEVDKYGKVLTGLNATLLIIWFFLLMAYFVGYAEEWDMLILLFIIVISFLLLGSTICCASIYDDTDRFLRKLSIDDKKQKAKKCFAVACTILAVQIFTLSIQLYIYRKDIFQKRHNPLSIMVSL